MKVVIDTNVLIAAFATRGLCKDVLEICLADHTIVLSEHIIADTQVNLTKKVKLPANIANDMVNFLRKNAELVEPVSIPSKACRDKDDLKVIGTAVASDADAIITGDNDLLSIRKYSSVQILSPRQFWEHLSH